MNLSLITDAALVRVTASWGLHIPGRLDVVEERGGKFYVMTTSRTRVLGGPYPSRKQAEERLAQIEYFKHAKRDALDPHHPAHATARAVAIHRAIGLGGKRRRVPRQQWPHLIESDYGAALARFAGTAYAALGPLREDLPGIAEQAARERGDAAARRDAGSTDKLKILLEQARATVGRMIAPRDVEDLARRFAAQTSTYQRIQLGKQTRAALGADVFSRDKRVPAMVDHFVAENVALIKSIPADLLADVEKLVTRGITSGRPAGNSVREGVRSGDVEPVNMAEDIDREFGIGERHARLIARDQVGKLYGQLNAYRQQDLGVTRFEWTTAGDERVRPEHEELNGRVFSYDDPPAEGLPGEPIQCRCYSTPLFDDIKGLVDDLEE